MDWDDPDEPPTEVEVRAPLDAANVALQVNGLLMSAVGAVLIVPTSPGVTRDVGRGTEAWEIVAFLGVGIAILIAAGWRRQRLVRGPVVGAVALFAAVPCLAILGAGGLIAVPTLGILALIFWPLPAAARVPGDVSDDD